MSTMVFRGVAYVCVVSLGLLSQVANAATLSLPEALEATNLVWTTGGHSSWYAQTTDTYDQSDAAQSGPLSNSQTNWIGTSVSGPGTISFWWKVSSEASWDLLTFSIGGVEQASVSGDGAWEFRVFRVAAGSQALRWQYEKDPAWAGNLDAAWLDQVAYVPDSALTAPVILTARPHAPALRPGRVFNFEFRAQQGISYVAEHKSDLGKNGWTVLSNVLAAGATATVVDPAAPATNRFYRVRLK
jgi:hypothetical protein